MAKKPITDNKTNADMVSAKRYRWYKWSRKTRRPGKEILSYDDWYAWQVSRGRDPKGEEDLRKPMTNHYSVLRFQRHRAQAKYRGIEFLFTWEEWHAWWLTHGEDRNIPSNERGSNRLCMCRKGDAGPYSPDNVYLATVAQNNSDSFVNPGVRPRRGRPPGSKNKPKT